MRRSEIGTILLGSVLSASAAASPPPAAHDQDDALAPNVATLVEAALDADREGAQIDALYRATILEHGAIDLLLAELDQLADSESEPPQRRRGALWTAAQLCKRRGDLDEALVHLDALATDLPVADVLLERARLLDALGRTNDAMDEYGRVLETVGPEDVELETFVRLRMALVAIERDDEAEDALAEFALEDERDPAIRNRAAVVLAILGRPHDAIDLFVAEGADSELFREEIRVAEWALRAGELDRARDYAWSAVRSATLSRDRHYALAVLVEAYRAQDDLELLLQRFSRADELDADSQNTWIDLLRETGRVDEAVELFRASAGDEDELSVEMRRELLEMYRDGGLEDVMVAAYRDLIAEQPAEVHWREGLARFFLERGDQSAARDVWRSFLDGDGHGRLLWGAQSLGALGQDDLATVAVELCVARGEDPLTALLFLFQLHRDRGRLDEAVAALARLDALAPADAPERMDLAEAWEQVGELERSVAALEAVKAARGTERAAEDLDMRLAWLYSESDEEERALELWRDLWTRVDSIPRRRYVEDRLMTVAARLGALADVAIELEKKLAAGTADERDSGLLVRLYSKVNDAVSAAEVIEEFMKKSGKGAVETLQEKARVYIACTDYHEYEQTIRELIELDPEGRGDYMRQLAMSQLERGKPHEARETLEALAEIEVGTDSAEFEAGVLALAGLRAEAIVAYRKGIAEHPERIESYLLMADLMKQVGELDRAVGMFQQLAEHAERDDLFTIAIDGLLNLEADERVLSWARRITLERLAGREDKMYLYQLLADLAEESDERAQMIVALENALPIAGERRASLLRELMDLAHAESDDARHLAYGRRLIGLSEVVPPQVYLDLGQAFLAADDVASASKTFRLASDLPDYDAFQRRAAGLFEGAGFREEALRTYERVLVSQASDAGLLAKVGELHEQTGRDDVAHDLYARAIELVLARRPLATTQKAQTEDEDDPLRWWGARNVDDYDQHYERCLSGLLATQSEAGVDALLAAQRDALRADLERVRADLADGEEPRTSATGEIAMGELEHAPRILRRAQLHRRVAFAFGRLAAADALDLELLGAFAADEDLLETLCRERVRHGLVASARDVLERSERPEAEQRAVRFLVGRGSASDAARAVPVDEARGLFLPMLVGGEREAASILLRRVDYAGVDAQSVDDVGALFAAALYLRDQDLALFVGREWLRLMVEHQRGGYEVQPVLQRCGAILDDERRRSLYEYFVDLVLADPAKASGFLDVLPELQDAFEEPLIDDEQLVSLIEQWDGDGWGWGLGPVIVMLPEEDRAGVLRSVWPKIQPTRRATFLVQLVSSFEEPMGQDLEDFVVESLGEALGEKDQTLQYYVDDLYERKENAAALVRIADRLLANDAGFAPAKALRALMLLALERTDEALEAATALAVDLIDGASGDWYETSALNNVYEQFLPEHLPAFLAAFDAAAAERKSTPELALKRVELVALEEDAAKTLAALEAALAEHPDDRALLERLRLEHQQGDRPVAALRTLEKLVALAEEDDDDERVTALKKQLVSAWKALDNPARALAVRRTLPAQEQESAQADLSAFGLAGVRFPPGTVVSVNGVTVVVGDEASDAPSIAKVKDALEEGDVETARVTFRRLWRKFPAGESGSSRPTVFFMTGGARSGSSVSLPWPEEEEDAQEDEEQEPPRGGLDELSEEEPDKAPEQVNAYRVLAEHAFGADEMRRLVRTKSARELDGMPDVVEGLARARTASSTPARALGDLLEDVRAGRAGQLEHALLLTLLDEHPGERTGEARAVLDDLARTLNPVDAAALRRLARVFARTGDTEAAKRLYSWCGTQANAATRYLFGGNTASVSADELVEEVKEMLAGDDRLAVLEDVLTFANPGEDAWRSEEFDALALQTWEELAGPAVALEKCRSICERATDFSRGLRRDAAKHAAWLYARAGELDRALACLEAGVCSLDPALFPSDLRWWYAIERPNGLTHADLRRLFPRDMDGWDARAWLLAAAAALDGWLDDERVRADSVAEALAVIARRLHELGDDEAARAVVGRLLARDTFAASKQLWIADAARECGLADEAAAIERRLLEDRRLHVERVPELVARELETAGPAAALALGEPAAELIRHAELLALLVSASEALADEERASRWRAAAQEAATARTELEAAEKADEANEDAAEDG